MGKRQLSELQPFEFVITLIIAELACIPLGDSGVPLVYGITPMFTLFILHLLITKLASKSLKVSKFTNGLPVVVMTPNGIEKEKLTSLNLNVVDLIYALRSQGYFYLEEIAYIIMETNGKLSVLPKEDVKKENPDSTDENSIPLPIICEGKILHKNLDKFNGNESVVSEILNKENMKKEDVLLLMLTPDKSYFLQSMTGDAVSQSLNG